jgi:DNA-directed RNA polymerase subunit RPC12/RpoP
MIFWKCTTCKLTYLEKDLNDTVTCKKCGGKLIKSCENDNYTCNHEITSGIKICEICGEFVCPICGCHNVNVISRVTGYYQDVSGWNKAKQNELKNRYRYDL